MAVGVELSQAAEESKICCSSACEDSTNPGGRQFRRMSIEAGKCYLQASRVKRAVLRAMGDLGCPLLVHDFPEMVIGRSSKSPNHTAQGIKVMARTGFKRTGKTQTTGLQSRAQFVGCLLRSICQITIDYLAQGCEQIAKWLLEAGEAISQISAL